MEILPSEYQQLNLSKHEKMFVRYAESTDEFGLVLLNVNPAMMNGESQQVVITSNGFLILKFFDEFDNPNMFAAAMGVYFNTLYPTVVDTVKKKLLTNKALLGSDKKLKIEFDYVCVFPAMPNPRIRDDGSDFYEFYSRCCLFKEEFSVLRRNFMQTIDGLIDACVEDGSVEKEEISYSNVNSVIQRIAPEYTTIRVSKTEDTLTYIGADEELLVVTNDDIAVKAYRLDAEQINVVNKIQKGEQLILACAGSGKSVILISKCFKAARMNPDKKFLLTCKNRQLQYLYTWYIDRAGLRERNVECVTFHKLCKKLAERNGYYLNQSLDQWPSVTIDRFNRGLIRDRYYGIFIDEVQLFEQEWYKLCYNLLENRDSSEHIFVICGDKTQEIVKKQRHGRAPWNAGEGYPSFRGGNRSIRIEKNYRNCVEVNDYINRYVTYAKKIYSLLPGQNEVDPDMFLRGKAFHEGVGTYVKKLSVYQAKYEAKLVVESVHEIHDKHKIPYDEIAVVIYNRTYGRRLKGWNEKSYNIGRQILIALMDEGIPRCEMYADAVNESTRYGANDGVSLISFESVLGLDFRAVIVCGLKPFGDYDGTKYLSDGEIKSLDADSEQIEAIRNNVRLLYVACTRARDVLYIIQPEDEKDSLYMRML